MLVITIRDLNEEEVDQYLTHFSLDTSGHSFGSSSEAKEAFDFKDDFETAGLIRSALQKLFFKENKAAITENLNR